MTNVSLLLHPALSGAILYPDLSPAIQVTATIMTFIWGIRVYRRMQRRRRFLMTLATVRNYAIRSAAIPDHSPSESIWAIRR